MSRTCAHPRLFKQLEQLPCLPSWPKMEGRPHGYGAGQKSHSRIKLAVRTQEGQGRDEVPKGLRGRVGDLSPSVLLVAVWVMDELPVDVLGLLRVELLSAIGALDLPVGLDANVDGRAIARLGGVADLHGFGHPCGSALVGEASALRQ